MAENLKHQLKDAFKLIESKNGTENLPDSVGAILQSLDVIKTHSKDAQAKNKASSAIIELNGALIKYQFQSGGTVATADIENLVKKELTDHLNNKTNISDHRPEAEKNPKPEAEKNPKPEAEKNPKPEAEKNPKPEAEKNPKTAQADKKDQVVWLKSSDIEKAIGAERLAAAKERIEKRLESKGINRLIDITKNAYNDMKRDSKISVQKAEVMPATPQPKKSKAASR